MKKYFIKDHGKITNCYANIAKMNPFEYIYCNFRYWSATKDIISNYIEIIKNFLYTTFLFVVNLVCLPLSPFVLFINAIYKIQKAKSL